MGSSGAPDRRGVHSPAAVNEQSPTESREKLPKGNSASAVGKMRDGDKVKTISGKEFTLGLKNNLVTLNGANVSKTDIQASNGVIHAIDSVILPN